MNNKSGALKTADDSYTFNLVGLDYDYDMIGTKMTLEEACEVYLKKVGPCRVVCTICGKESPALANARTHLEGKHLPPGQGYSCQLCMKFCTTRHALSCHMSRNHRNLRQ